MHIWTDLATREGVFLLVLLALGAGPASLLAERFDGAARIALAPAFGLCAGVALTDTLVQWFPVHQTYWVVVVLAVASVGLAFWRAVRHRMTITVRPSDVAQFVVIAVLVLGPPSATLHGLATVGPGGLNVFDAAGYVAEIDSMQTRSIGQASSAQPPYRNLTQEYWIAYARAYQNIDASGVMASVNDLMGLGATDTQSPFMITLLLVGALGIFAGFRYLTESRSWGGVLAAGLFGGPVFMQLWADSSQAAICGLALIPPFFLLGAEVLSRGRLSDIVLLSLVVAGVLTVYPLFAPALAIGGAVVLFGYFLGAWRSGRLRGRETVIGATRLVGLITLAAALSPIAFGRDLRYWQAILQGTLSFASLPQYHLPIGVLPGWLLQTRQFYDLLPLGVGGFKEFLPAVLLPLPMLAVIVAGVLWRHRAVALLPFLLAFALLAEYVGVKNGCEYCTQRNLLPIAPMGALMLGVGVAYLAQLRTPVGRVLAVLATLLIVLAVGERVRVERQLVLDTAYFLNSPDRGVLAHLPRGNPVVEVEGFGESIRGPGEMPLVYDLVNERTDNHASMAMDSTDYSSFAYLLGPDQPAAFNPRYRYVLTRFGGVKTDRRIIAIDDGIALEERTRQLDVTPVADLGAPLARFDTAGDAWVQLAEPLLFFVSGATGDRAVWVRLGLATEEAVAVPRQLGVQAHVTSNRVTICIRARGTGPVRQAIVSLSFSGIPGPTPALTYTLPQPIEGVELLSMMASTRRCTT